ncbi:expressed unknown protein [Ectocarpus siliculosus]|uniref:Uncharacterized protein n=1 Tax=Ectocarpus siliculosus TaxID=2880 RepID=D7G6S3_ECTSI|nr:expressed unknown protein [Ectocarpus siliculosus]|eukprot:CBJ27617.1 expressed unknown protein [Ectocarpus siliculosus]
MLSYTVIRSTPKRNMAVRLSRVSHRQVAKRCDEDNLCCRHQGGGGVETCR